MPTPYLVGTQSGFIGQASYLDGGASRGPNFQQPPFEFNGKTYTCFTNIELDPGNPPRGILGSFLAVASSPDRQTFTVLDTANAPEIATSGQTSPSYYIVDLPNSRVVFFSVSQTTVLLFAAIFNLLTETWGAPFATGGPQVKTPQNLSAPVIGATQISINKYCVVYNAPSNALKCVILDSGTWGAPSTIVAAVGLTQGFLSGLCIIPNGTTFVFYQKTASNVKLCYNRIDSSGAVLGEVEIAHFSFASFFIFKQSVPKYITADNVVVLPSFVDSNGSTVPAIANQIFLVIISDPDTSPTVTIEGVADDSVFTDLDVNGAPYFFTSIDELTQYLAIQVNTNLGGTFNQGWEQIWLFNRPSTGGAWSGPDIVFTSQVDQPPLPLYDTGSGLVAPPAELNSIAFTYYTDGALAGTFGMLSNVCGVEFFISIGGSPPEPGCPTIFIERQPQPEAPSPAAPPITCTVYTPTTSTPSFISYDEPLELQGS